MKKTLFILVSLLVSQASKSQDLKVPTLSPMTEISQEVGLTVVKLSYSRPSAKGRQVFGELVPYGEVWRTGANAATKLTFNEDVKIGGNELPAGMYALYTIPDQFKWTIIIHKNTKHRSLEGNYNPEEDAFRFEVMAETLPKYLETFTIQFSDLSTNSMNINLAWANVRVKIPVEFEVDAKIEAQMAELLKTPEKLNGFTYFRAAEFFLHNDKDLNKAREWIDAALSKSPQNFRFGLLKAKIILAQGDHEEALRVVQTANEWAIAAKNDNYIHQTGQLLEHLLTDYKLLGVWVKYGSVDDPILVNPSLDNKYERFTFNQDGTLEIVNHSLEKGRKGSFKMIDQSSFVIDKVPYKILFDGGDSLIIESRERRKILLKEARYLKGKPKPVTPVFDANVGLHNYFFDSRRTVSEMSSQFAYDLVFLANEKDILIDISFEVQTDGKVSNIEVESNYPEADQKIRNKIQNTSGLWMVPEQMVDPATIKLQLTKQGIEGKEKMADAEVIFQKGKKSLDKGKIEDAIKFYSLAIDQIPAGKFYYYRGKAYAQLSEKEKSCDDIKMALRYNIESAIDLAAQICN